MVRRILLFIILISVQVPCTAQNIYISNFTQKEYRLDYGVSPQNWDMQQDSIGRLFIANSSGVLVYDGFAWDLIPGTENKNMRALDISNDGIIYAGGRDDLGYFKSDSLGRVIFVSLLPSLKKQGD